jgi:hypothetical protein
MSNQPPQQNKFIASGKEVLERIPVAAMDKEIPRGCHAANVRMAFS